MLFEKKLFVYNMLISLNTEPLRKPNLVLNPWLYCSSGQNANIQIVDDKRRHYIVTYPTLT
jgi:hypothetical protein